MPTFTKPLDVIGMCGMLCAIRLRISEDYHRLLSARGSGISQQLVPWQVFATDPQAKHTAALVVDIIQTYGDMLHNMNPNCMALWHNMCIMLTTDLQMFELGAGSASAKPAQKALEDIAVWSQTPAARRAIVHAAQTFKLMSDRRPLDGDPFYSSNGLFLAALVLGLYVFMVPPADNDSDMPVYELLDDVNWDIVDNKGLAYENRHIDDPTVSFIRKGGPISLSGIIHHNGYPSARRILLDFSCLLEDIEKWRIGHYTKVLRIMSDSLVEREKI